MRNKRLVNIILISISLLLIPLVAMPFTNEVEWTIADFMVAGALFMGAGLVSEVILRTKKKIRYKVGAISAVVIVVALIWIELAVGILGTPFAGN